jgi:hypothetical protein
MKYGNMYCMPTRFIQFNTILFRKDTDDVLIGNDMGEPNLLRLRREFTRLAPYQRVSKKNSAKVGG